MPPPRPFATITPILILNPNPTLPRTFPISERQRPERPLAPSPTQAGEEALARGVGRVFASRRGDTGVFRAANRYTVSLQGVRGA